MDSVTGKAEETMMRNMTTQQIRSRQSRASIKYELAEKIRSLLDKAREQYGASDWDEEGIEDDIAELVFEDSD